MKAEHRDEAPRPAVAAGTGVVHLVGRITDTVYSFLGPATQALAEQGYAQTVVMIDDPRFRHVLTKFHKSVRLVLVNATSAQGDQIRELLDAYCEAARVDRPAVAHLHGLVCSVLGLYASRLHHVDMATYFTPHGSKSLAPLRGLGAALPWVLRPLSGRLGHEVVASSGHDAESLRDITRGPVHLVESPVNAAFFTTQQVAAAAPCVVTAYRAGQPAGAERYAQCAVLLADAVPGLQFQWLGPVAAESADRLRAACVQVLDLGDDETRAAHMARASVYVSPAGGLGFPVFLAEAMAMGLPCVAWDTPYHRDLLRDGETGFLCRSADDVLYRVVELLASEELRQRIGQAARAEAQVRFDGTRFRAALLGLYGTRPAPLALPAGHGATRE